jgi:hypothetical protein
MKVTLKQTKKKFDKPKTVHYARYIQFNIKDYGD